MAERSELYDGFRRNLGGSADFHMVMTAGVAAAVSANEVNLAPVLDAVRNFNDFNPANDPHGEHDFAKITVADRDYFWKIDDYGPDWKSAASARYILTLMFTEDY